MRVHISSPQDLRSVCFRGLQACGRLYPFFRGASRLASLRPFRACVPRDSTAVVRLRNGLQIVIFPHDFIGRTISFFGDNDRKISWVCQRVLRPGDAVLDIGAHHGLITLYAAACVGPSGVVHAFEPQPGLADTLRASVAKNGIRNVTVHAVALADHDGEMRMSYPPNDLSSATLEHRPGWRQQDVPVRAAGSYLASLNLPPLRLIKIDVEGYEATVLGGAKTLLQENAPDVIVFESHHHDAAAFWQREVVQLLSERLEYDIFQVPKAMVRMGVRAIPEGVEPAHDSYDFVAVCRDASDRAAILMRLRAR